MNLFTQVTAGIIIFNEWVEIWGELLIWQKIIKIGSIILIFLGVAILSFAKAEQEVPLDMSGKEEEEGEKVVEKEKIQIEVTLEEIKPDIDEHYAEEKPLSQIKDKISKTKIDDTRKITPGTHK